MRTEPMERREAEELYSSVAQAAEQRRHSRRIAKTGATGFSVLILAGSLFWAGWSLRDLGTDSDVPVGASHQPAANYSFSHIQVKHSVDPRTRNVIRKGWTITAMQSWTPSHAFPGDHSCRATALDASGDTISTARFDYESDTPTGRTVVMGVRGVKPGTAIIRCDPKRLDSPVAYSISNERVQGSFSWRDHVSGVEVAFDVTWPVKLPDYPGTNECTAIVRRSSGEVVARQAFGLGVGPGPMKQRVWRDDFSDPSALNDISDLQADIACHPFTAADVSPKAWAVTPSAMEGGSR